MYNQKNELEKNINKGNTYNLLYFLQLNRQCEDKAKQGEEERQKLWKNEVMEKRRRYYIQS